MFFIFFPCGRKWKLSLSVTLMGVPINAAFLSKLQSYEYRGCKWSKVEGWRKTFWRRLMEKFWVEINLFVLKIYYQMEAESSPIGGRQTWDRLHRERALNGDCSCFSGSAVMLKDSEQPKFSQTRMSMSMENRPVQPLAPVFLAISSENGSDAILLHRRMSSKGKRRNSRCHDVNSMSHIVHNRRRLPRARKCKPFP